MSGKESHEQMAELETRKRTGGRSARVIAAVHAAALQILEERGYEQLEIPEVAERAKVYKTTIYRRWPNKLELVLDVALTHLGTNVPMQDMGSLQGDLIALLSRIQVMLETPFAKGLLRVLMTVQDLNGDFQKAQITFWNTRFEYAKIIVERAIQRKELPTDTNPNHLIEFAAAPLFYRMLITAEKSSNHDIQRIARQTIQAFS